MNNEARPLVVAGFTISTDLFTKGFAFGQGPCACTSSCCSGGVYVDLLEHEKILAHQELIQNHMDETQVKLPAAWFEQEVVEDGDFPSGQCVGTTVVNGKCAFLDGMGCCSLQSAASAEGLGRWALKPLYCILYPVEITNRVINFDSMLQNEESCCSVNNPFDVPVFQACHDELVHVLGEDGFAALEVHYRTFHQHSEVRP
jgi:hypothetical protein